MDLSKLPRLSESDKHAPPAGSTQESVRSDAAAASPVAYARPAALTTPGVGAQVWLSLVIGIILMLVGQNFARYTIAKLTGRPFHTHVTWTEGPKAGQEVEYFELIGYTAWTEMGIFLFGLAMVLEGVLLALIARRITGTVALAAVAFAVTVLATALNLWICIKLFGAGTIPLMSGLAVAFGGYMAAYEWHLLRGATAATGDQL